MQTGTTPARRTVTEPASDRSALPTGPCQRTRSQSADGPTAHGPTVDAPEVVA